MTPKKLPKSKSASSPNANAPPPTNVPEALSAVFPWVTNYAASVDTAWFRWNEGVPFITVDGILEIVKELTPKSVSQKDTDFGDRVRTPIFTHVVNQDGECVILPPYEDRDFAGKITLKYIYIYVRVSTQGQESRTRAEEEAGLEEEKDGWSIPWQVKRGAMKAIAIGYAFRLYSDSGISGGTGTNTPGEMQELIANKATKFIRAIEKIVLDPTDTYYTQEQKQAVREYTTQKLETTVRRLKQTDISREDLEALIDRWGVDIDKPANTARQFKASMFRPGLSTMQADFGQCSHVIVADLSRLSRSATLTITLAKRMRNITYIGLLDGTAFDTNDEMARGVLGTVLGAQAERVLAEACVGSIRGTITLLESGRSLSGGALSWWLARDKKSGKADFKPGRLAGRTYKEWAERAVSLFVEGDKKEDDQEGKRVGWTRMAQILSAEGLKVSTHQKRGDKILTVPYRHDTESELLRQAEEEAAIPSAMFDEDYDGEDDEEDEEDIEDEVKPKRFSGHHIAQGGITRNMVRAMMDNPALVGEQRFLGLRFPVLPRVISDEQMEGVAARMATNAEFPGGRGGRISVPHPLLSLCRCTCKRYMTKKPGRYNRKAIQQKRTEKPGGKVTRGVPTAERNVMHCDLYKYANTGHHVAMYEDDIHRFLSSLMREHNALVINALSNDVQSMRLEHEIEALASARAEVLADKREKERRAKTKIAEWIDWESPGTPAYLAEEAKLLPGYLRKEGYNPNSEEQIEARLKDARYILAHSPRAHLADLEERCKHWDALSPQQQNDALLKCFESVQFRGEVGSEYAVLVLNTSDRRELPEIPLRVRTWGKGFQREMPSVEEWLAQSKMKARADFAA